MKYSIKDVSDVVLIEKGTSKVILSNQEIKVSSMNISLEGNIKENE